MSKVGILYSNSVLPLASYDYRPRATKPSYHPIFTHQEKTGVTWEMNQANGKKETAENDRYLLLTEFSVNS